ncbi:hypothetical protein I4U23_026663 [Adineta vaga]|nr:hypothetical protein I4U23_026663 [Adineta vaga]
MHDDRLQQVDVQQQQSQVNAVSLVANEPRFTHSVDLNQLTQGSKQLISQRYHEGYSNSSSTIKHFGTSNCPVRTPQTLCNLNDQNHFNRVLPIQPST